jgi:hypothetical protein
MTQTIAPAQSPAAESPHIPRPETDGAALRAIEEAMAHVREGALHEMARQQPDILKGQDHTVAMLDNFASKDMPGRKREIRDCVDKIRAKVDPAAATA